MGAAAHELAALGIIDSYMVAASVLTEMVFHCGVGVSYGDVSELCPATVLSSPEKGLEIYHVVHDGVVPAECRYLTRPRQHGSCSRIPEFGKTLGRSYDDVLVALVAGKSIAVAVAAEHYEAQVMVVCGLVRQKLQSLGISLCRFQDSLILGILIRIPQHSRPESLCPEFLAHRSLMPYGVPRSDVARRHHAVIRTKHLQRAGSLLQTIVKSLLSERSLRCTCRQQHAHKAGQ